MTDKQIIEGIALGYYMQKEAEQPRTIQQSNGVIQTPPPGRALTKLLEEWRGKYYHN